MDSLTCGLERFSFCFFLSKEQFIKEYKTLCEKEEAPKLYYLALTELEKSATLGNVESFQNVSSLIKNITSVENDITLKGLYENGDNPLKHTNLIILACKYNKVEILRYIYMNSDVLKNLSVDLGKIAITLDDEDEMCHNSFYYAIHSSNVELLEILVSNKWPGNNSPVPLNEMDKILSSAYEELKLKNVPLSNEMEMYVESKLLNLRFFSNPSDVLQNVPDKNNTVKERINLVLENICLMLDYTEEKVIDDRFLYMAKFVVQNIHILKKLLKSTYNILPWEEIEFCLITYISSHIKQNKNYLFNCALLSKCKMLRHLKHFSEKLKKYSLTSMNLSKQSQLPNLKREKVVELIIANDPQFEELYSDYQQIRDIHSLQTIKNYLTLSVSVDVKEREGQLIITRALQVVGEYLKNTLESPNLSTSTSELLLLLLPKNTREIFAELRNSLSHTYSLDKRTEMESNVDIDFFISIQNDTKKIGDVITDILFNTKVKIVRMLLKYIANSENLYEIREFAKTLGFISLDEISSVSFKTVEHEKLEKLVEELGNTVSVKTLKEQQLFKEIMDIIKFEKNKSKNIENDYVLGFSSLKCIILILNDSKIDNNVIRDIKYTANQSLEYLSPKIKSHSLKKIVELTMKFCKLVMFRLPLLQTSSCQETDLISQIFAPGEVDLELKLKTGSGFDAQNISEEMTRLSFEIFNIAKFGINNIKWIQELERKLNKKICTSDNKQNVCFITEKKYFNQLKAKLSELESILSKNSFYDQSLTTESFSIYKNDKRLQAMIEMLVLDILSILGTSQNSLENNLYFLDDNASLLTGKCLRNHLAHYNAVVNVLMTDPLIAVLLNAQKLTSENIIQSKKKFGKFVVDNPSKLKYKCEQDLLTIANQENMFIALKEDNIEALKISLRNGADIKGRDINLWTALHFAAKGSSLETMKFIFDQYQNMNVKDINGRNPLHIAAVYGNTALLEFLIKEVGISVDEVDTLGKMPVHIAAQNGHKETVEFLMQNKTYVTLYDKSGLSPLHNAIRNGHIDVAQVLLEKETDVDHDEAIGGFTPLHEAARRGLLDLVIFLIKRGANINAKTDRDWTPLFAATHYGHPEVVRYLISKGADVNATVIDGCTLLHYAVQSGNEEVVDIFLEHGAKVDAIHKTLHNTALHYAAMDGHEDIAKKLLQHKANGNAVTFEGLTPIHIAALRGHIKVVTILIEHGININAKSKNNSSPLQCAVECGNMPIIDLLLKNNALVNTSDCNGFTPLHVAAQKGFTEVADLLIKSKAEVNARAKNGSMPLHIAALNGKNSIIDLLLNNNAQINGKDGNGLTPLYGAAENGHKDSVALLIKNNAIVNVKNITTPLHVAAINGHKDVIDILLKNYASIHAKDKSGCTALRVAVEEDHKEIVDLLITNGALINIKKEDKMNLIIAAVMNNNKEIVKVLLENGVNANLEGIAVAIFAGNRDIVKVFLETGANINFRSTEYPLLNLAAQAGHHDIVNDLIVHGAYVDTLMNNATPLFLAAKEGHEKVVEILIINGAKVDTKSFLGVTPLFAAATLGHSRVAKVLIDNKANVKWKFQMQNRTAVETAVLMGHLNVLEVFLQHKDIDVNTKGFENFTLLHIAAEGNQLGIIKYLIEKGSDIHARNCNGAQPIHIAARQGFKNIVEFLLGKGCSISDLGFVNQTVLHYAIVGGNLEVVKYLIEQGGDVNAKDMNDCTSVYFASVLGHKNVLKVLLENGAVYNAIDKLNKKRPSELTQNAGVLNILSQTEGLFKALKSNNPSQIERFIKSGAIVNAKNAEKGMPLHYVAWKGHLEVAKVLLRNKCNPNAVHSGGFTPLHYAAKFSHFELVKILLCYGAMYNAVSGTGKTPLDLAVDESIITLLKFVDQAFKSVESNKSRVINDLKKLKDVDSVKAVLKASNSKKETLVVSALLSNFSRVEDLKEILQDGVSTKINMAVMYFNVNDYQSSLNIFRSVLEEREEILGPNNPGTLDIQSYIAKILYKQGAYDDALNLYNNMLIKQKEMFGLKYKDTLSTRSAIALILHRLNKDEALDIFKEVYDMQKEILGPNHTDTLETQLYMAVALDGHEKYDEALYHNQEVYRRRQKENHPAALLAQNNIANVLANQGKLEEALKLFKEVLDKKKAIFGISHADTLRTSQHIAGLLLREKKFPEALKAYKELLDIQKRVLGQNHPDTSNTQFIMADIHFSQGKWIAALQMYNEILHRRKSIWGENHPSVLNILTKINLINFRLKYEGGDESSTYQQLQKNINVATNDGDIQDIQYLLKNGADVNDQDTEGRTPLHYASGNGQTSVIKILLENGADVTQVNYKDETSLHTAASKGYKGVVQILLQHVSRENLSNFINAQTVEGNTSLHFAAKIDSLDTILSLLEYGAIYDIKNKEGKTPFDISKNQNVKYLLKLIGDLFKDVKYGNISTIKNLKLIKSEHLPAVTNVRDNLGRTLLQVAAAKQHKHIAAELLSIIKMLSQKTFV